MTPLSRREVPAAFDGGAAAYDRLVGANPGYHAHLRRSARTFAAAGSGERLRLLDAGCGTGASTAALLAAVPDARVVGVDASPGMLARARAKPWPATVEFVHSRVEDLAETAGPFDGIFAAYLIRNLPDPDAALRSLRALLRPGGLLVVHDYSVRDSPLTRLVWHTVCWTLIIPAGRLLTGDARLYRYLWRSALDFDGPDAFADRLRRAGFADVQAGTMTGWQKGIVHAFRGRRPAERP